MEAEPIAILKPITAPAKSKKQDTPKEFDQLLVAAPAIEELLSADPMAEEKENVPVTNLEATKLQNKPLLQVVQPKINFSQDMLSDSDLVEAMDLVDPSKAPSKPVSVVRDDIANGVEDWRTGAQQDKQVVIDVDTDNRFNTEELLVYWIDASEDKFNNPGTVYIFGKVRSSSSSLLTQLGCHSRHSAPSISELLRDCKQHREDGVCRTKRRDRSVRSFQRTRHCAKDT